MVNITISVSDKNRERLGKVENKSGLINSLLDEHFIEEESLDVLNLKLKEIEAEHEKQIQSIKRKIMIQKQREEYKKKNLCPQCKSPMYRKQNKDNICLKCGFKEEHGKQTI